MTTESLQKRIDEQKITDRAMELFEAQSPHQLAVTLAYSERMRAEAMSALDRMTDQRDQLAAQLEDATAQLARAGDLLREARDVWDFHEDPEAATLVHASGVSIRLWLENVDGYLAGEVLPPAAPKPEAQ